MGGGEGSDQGSREASSNGLSAIPFPAAEVNLATMADSPQDAV